MIDMKKSYVCINTKAVSNKPVYRFSAHAELIYKVTYMMNVEDCLLFLSFVFLTLSCLKLQRILYVGVWLKGLSEWKFPSHFSCIVR